MEKIAIIGTGIAGMSSAYFLRESCDITFYEKNDYPGGHTNTLTVKEDGRDVFIDSGFIVFNHETYPNFLRFLQELDIKTAKTTMSFSLQHLPSGLEYCGAGLTGLFGRLRNIVDFGFWKLLFAMMRFNTEAPEVLEGNKYAEYTVARYAREKKFGEDFLEKFLLPLSSAVWSAPSDKMLDFPIVTLVRFFKNHGFMGLYGHYQWYTVEGGSRNYRDKVMGMFDSARVRLKCAAQMVSRRDGKAVIVDSTGQKISYDRVVFACHADEALELLGDPNPEEEYLLGHFKYQPNRVKLHTDESVMPKTRRLWSAWNYRVDADEAGGLKATTVYDMNILQKVSKTRNYFISINDPGLIDPQKVLWETVYHHPIFTVDAARVQRHLPELNKNGCTYFCGSYFRYGFHEDAFTSGLEVAREIRGERIWD